MRVCLIMMLCSTLFFGCAPTATREERGTAAGAGIGAATGALLGQAIGHDSKSTVLGAAAGALIGGIAGNRIGAYMDAQEEAFRRELADVEDANIRRNADTLALTFKSEMFFDVDSSAMKAAGYDEIGRVARVLNQYPQTTILVAGHTDATGSDDYNQRLSERRAEVVSNALVGEGVNPRRLRTIGYGESRPVAGNRTPEGRQLNRRVELTIEPIRN